jgi:hypothetical protein
MKKAFGISVLFVTLLVLGPRRAFAADPGDGGTDGDALIAGGAPSDGGGPVADDASGDGSVAGGAPSEAPLGCDGALCATVAGDTTCAFAGGRRSSGASLPTSAALVLAAIGFGARRRRATRERERRR